MKKAKKKTISKPIDSPTRITKGKYDQRNKLNDLTSTEWIPETISVWIQKGLGAKHPDTKIEREHPAPFSFTDVGRLIRFFTKRDQIVLDPFLGIGSTLKACAIEGRRGIGIELNKKYTDLSKKRLKNEMTDLFVNDDQTVILGDSREILDTLDENSVDFIVTSPPYWSILHKEDHKVKQERKDKELDTKYSNNKKDLGNIEEYSVFLSELTAIFEQCIRVLKPQKYIAIVVSDFRDKSKFIMFHADLANSLCNIGYELKGIKVLYQRHKRIFPYGYPYAYVPNIHHQYILILQKKK